MTLINDGTLTIEKGYTEQFLKLLIDQNTIMDSKHHSWSVSGTKIMLS